jgi:hypothetical protein
MLPILRGRLDLISPNATPLFYASERADDATFCSGGYVIRDPGNRSLERSEHGAKHRIALEI